MDAPEHGEWLEGAALAALGALDREDQARFAAHLRSGCALCLAELREAERTCAALAALARPEPAPSLLRERVLASCARPASPFEVPPVGGRARPPAASAPRRAGRGWLRPLAATAAAVALALVAWRTAGTLERERALRHQAELALVRAESAGAAAERERDRLVALVETVAAPSSRAIVLAGAQNVPGARGRAFVEPVGQRIVLLVHDLPPPPPGRTYQLWTIEAGVPASAGTFATSLAGLARFSSSTPARLGEAIALAVTVEPEGGVPQPSGPVVLAQR